MTVPADIVNRALDSIGYETPVSDLRDGSRASQVALRIYGPTRQQLLRAAHWNFARRRAVLTLLQDSTGNTTAYQISQGYPQTVGTGTPGMVPWTYEYQWPNDGLKARFLPCSPYPQSGGGYIPPTTASYAPGSFYQNEPTAFVVGVDIVPPTIGVPSSWSDMPANDGVPGIGRGQQTVILTNTCNAALVYTADVVDPDQWDPLFTEAMVQAIAARLAMALLDRKIALPARGEAIKIAKMALDAARVSDGNEGVPTQDHVPDFIRARQGGGSASGWGNGYGSLWYGWDSFSFGDGLMAY